ncbi:flippase [Elizabethkingia anophelis]|uniref:flippase n=1 Tax=Elizabethkingia anophelis TaxID=1117645 RepID=UPI000C99D54E|nr:flippase [Elizabethkingia anophelis]MCT3643477.1 flippase [Elizabethkingia anophelis]MCT3650271.1 flippase [Elizabethkingia anophelis]MCT3657731.1 flippase [Elizabethkingia anophelis]MCT3664995.1 flippase [Elizabethkingia anophelis]MCT3676360.1 flippase [Elizabethkingia anophelis]
MEIFKRLIQYKVQINNFISLFILQGLNFVLPLVTFPYLFRTLGVDNFGLVSFSTALLFYFQIFVDFGFNLSGARHIALNRKNKETLNVIYSSIIYSKLLLILVGFVILFISVISIHKLRQNYALYYISYLVIIGQTFFSNWFFQGMEKMRNITVINIITKVLSTLFIFLYVKRNNDYLLVPIFYSIGNFVSAIISVLIIRIKYNVSFVKVPLSSLIYYIKDAVPLFISNLSVTLYTFSTVLLLGFFFNNTIVGYYTLAERIIAAIKSIINPISQSLYPFLTIKAAESRDKVLAFNFKFLIIMGAIFFLICFLIFISSPYILLFFFGNDSLKSLTSLRIMLPIPLLLIIDTVLATFTLLVFNYSKYYSKAVLIVGVVNVFVASVLIYYLKDTGAALSTLLSEFLVTIILFIYCKKTNLLPIRSRF